MRINILSSIVLRAVFVLCGVVASVRCLAQYPGPRLGGLTPAAIVAGETVVVKVSGELLEDTDLCFSVPGLRSVRGKKQGEFEVVADAGLASGVVEAWVRGPHGVSGARRIWVGGSSLRREEGDHGSVGKALRVEVPSEVAGFAEKEAVDWYRVALGAGQTLHARLSSEGLDSNLLGVLSLTDVQGMEIAGVSVRDEGELVYRASTAGEVCLKVNDLVFRGGDAFPYVLRLSDQPLPRSIVSRFPVPPLPGSSVTEWRAEGPRDFASGDHWVRGSFGQGTRRATFEFEAQKSETWGVDVYASRLGMVSDMRAWVEKVGGSVVWEGEDGGLVNWEYPLTHRDPSGRFEVKEDGRYRLVIEEQLSGGSAVSWWLHVGKVGAVGPSFAGVVSPMPAKEVVVPQRSTNLEATVTPAFFRRGSLMAFRVVVERAAAWKGDVTIRLEEGPEGVTMEDLVLNGDESSGILTVHALPDAKGGEGVLRFAATGGGVSVPLSVGIPVRSVTAQELVDGPRWRLLSGLMALVQPVDAEFKVSMSVENPTLKKGEKLKGKFRVELPKDFKGPVKVRLGGAYGLEKMPEVTIGEGGEAPFEVGLSELKLGTGSHFVHAVVKPKFVPATAGLLESVEKDPDGRMGKKEEAKKPAEIEAVFRSASQRVELKP
jgi:hypothetical protein